MDRKLFGFFSSTQVTGIIVAAIVAPSAVYAVATTSVAITDPLSGKQALVDAGRRVYVYDPVAGLANSPLDFVRTVGNCSGTSNTFTYTPPTGKALIVKAVDFTYYAATAGNDNYIYLDGANFVAGLDSPDAANFKNSDLGNGYYLRNGENLHFSCASTGTYIAAITGYLVPTGYVPSSQPAAEAANPITKDGKAL